MQMKCVSSSPSDFWDWLESMWLSYNIGVFSCKWHSFLIWLTLGQNCLKKCNISNHFWLSMKTTVHPTAEDLLCLSLIYFLILFNSDKPNSPIQYVTARQWQHSPVLLGLCFWRPSSCLAPDVSSKWHPNGFYCHWPRCEHLVLWNDPGWMDVFFMLLLCKVKSHVGQECLTGRGSVKRARPSQPSRQAVCVLAAESPEERQFVGDQDWRLVGGFTSVV